MNCTLDELRQRIEAHRPRQLDTDQRFPQAAVLVPITRSDDPELVLTLRAAGEGDLAAMGGQTGGATRKTPTWCAPPCARRRRRSPCRRAWWKWSGR